MKKGTFIALPIFLSLVGILLLLVPGVFLLSLYKWALVVGAALSSAHFLTQRQLSEKLLLAPEILRTPLSCQQCLSLWLGLFWILLLQGGTLASVVAALFCLYGINALLHALVELVPRESSRE